MTLVTLPTIAIALLFMLNTQTNAQTNPVETFQSPCPQLFIYEGDNNEADRWYGIITLLSETDVSSVSLRLIFDRQSVQLGNWFGEISTSNNKEYLIKNANHQLKANVPETLRFYLKYNPKGPVPMLISFGLNDKTVCPAISIGSGGQDGAVARPGVDTFQSPCPQLFIYEGDNNEPDRWYGIVTLLSETDVSSVSLRLIFDRQSLQLGNWFGEIGTTDNTEYLVRNSNHSLKANVPEMLRFYLKYDPNGPIPKLLSFRLNDKTVCPAIDIGSGGQDGAVARPGVDTFQSPCPQLFIYEGDNNEPDRWYGIVTLLSETDVSSVSLRLIFDRQSLQLGNWFGEIGTTDNKEYVVRNSNHSLKANVPETLRFYLKYNPNGPVPMLLSFQLNSKTVCPAAGGGGEGNALVRPNRDTFQSPCPQLFIYEGNNNEPDKWYGVVTLLSDTDISGVFLRLTFDEQAIQLGNWFGEIGTTDNKEFLIRNPNHPLKANVPETLRFYLKYNPNGPIPMLVSFTLNAKTLCPVTGGGEVNALARPNRDTFQSPCPQLFIYEGDNNEPDKWYGVVTLLSDTDLSGVFLRLMFDGQSLQLGNWFGEIGTTDNKEYLIRNPNHPLKANVPETLRFYLKYNPNGPIPMLVSFSLNAKMVCPATDIGSRGSVALENPNVDTFQSPCPQLFVYEGDNNEPDRWYGIVTLLSKSDLSSISLRLIFDRQSVQIGNWFGEVATTDHKEYVIRNRNHQLKANVSETVRFYLKYKPKGPVPRLISFRLNDKTVCPE